ncbi:hypothetical protein LTR70_010765, partial [Exophiala xenobiotica]
MSKRVASRAASPSASPEKKQRLADMQGSMSELDLSTSLSTAPQIKTEPGMDFEDDSKPAFSDVLQAIVPEKRGRKVGSGAGQTRKKVEDYSTNPHTQKSRARKAKIATNPFAAALERKKSRLSVRVSREMTKWKNSPAYRSEITGASQETISKLEAEKRIEIKEK